VAASAESSYTYYKKRVAVCQFWERKLLAFRDAFVQYRVALPDALDAGAVRVEDVRCADVVEDCRAWLEPLESSLAKNVLFRRQHKQLINGYIEVRQTGATGHGRVQPRAQEPHRAHVLGDCSFLLCATSISTCSRSAAAALG